MSPAPQPLVRIYHRDRHAPSPLTLRTFGPLWRFDHHLSGHNRAATYAGSALRTAVREAIHGADEWAVCPNLRVAVIEPATAAFVTQDFITASPSDLGAPDDLGDGEWDYSGTQMWARAIYERYTQPVGGISYWSRFDRDDSARLGVNIVLWDSGPTMRVTVRTAHAQDFSLLQPDIWSRVLAFVDSAVRLRQILAADCGRCNPP